jgi:hypothetical protein
MVNAFSFCLYGPTKPIYHDGFLENLVLIKTHYPGWVVYLYLGSDTDAAFRERMLADPTVRVRDTAIAGAKNMVHRFFAIDEPDVDVCFFRDADSRIHWKDRWAINNFMKTGYTCHIIRDQPDHNARIMGGLWGLRKGAVPSMRALWSGWTPASAGYGDPNDLEGYGVDQNFACLAVYPRVAEQALVHFSHNQFRSETRAVRFPFRYTNDVYCGRVEAGPFVDSPAPSLPFSFVKIPMHRQ